MRINDPERVLKFLRCLKLVEGEMAGRYYEPMPWHEEVVRGIFSPVDDAGKRKVREAYISVPRKNSKTTFIGALGVYFLFADGEQGAQVYCVATSVEQAKICFRVIAGMIRQQPTLKGMCRIIESRNEILVPGTNSRLKVLSKLAGQAHGLNPSFVIYDELHAAQSRELYDVMITGMGAREQPLMIAITTAGYDRKSICYEKYVYGKGVIGGTVQDDSFYAYISEPTPEDDWHDPEVWEKVNPAWGVSVHPEFIEAQYRQAVNTPSFENSFRQLYLNEWVSQSSRWLSMDAWDRTTAAVIQEDFAGCGFYCGLDLSATQDLTAFVMCCAAGGKCFLFPYFFLPAECVEQNKINKAVYAGWARSGALITTPGNVIDYDYLVDYIKDLGSRFGIRGIAYDPWNSSYPVSRLAEDFEMLKYPQSFANLSPAAKDFERGLLAGEILHMDHPILRWCADNVEIYSRGGNIKPVAPTEDNKIDGIIASIMAYDLLQKSGGSSVYEERGIIAI